MDKTTTRPKRTLLRACGVAGILGSLFLVGADIAGIVIVERHDPISETISRLAVGKYGWIQDVGLYCFAAGALACAAALYALKRMSSATAATAMVLMAASVVVIAFYNQYAGRGSSAVHTYSVYAFGVLFGFAALVLAFGLHARRWWKRFSATIGVAWIPLAPLLFVIPTGWDGAYERFLGLIVVVWTAALSWIFVRSRSVATPFA